MTRDSNYEPFDFTAHYKGKDSIMSPELSQKLDEVLELAYEEGLHFTASWMRHTAMGTIVSENMNMASQNEVAAGHVVQMIHDENMDKVKKSKVLKEEYESLAQPDPNSELAKLRFEELMRISLRTVSEKHDESLLPIIETVMREKTQASVRSAINDLKERGVDIPKPSAEMIEALKEIGLFGDFDEKPWDND